MTAKEYLRQISQAREWIKSLQTTQEQLRLDMLMISSPSLDERVQTSPRDRMPEMMAKLESNEAKLALAIERKWQLIMRITEQVEQLNADKYERQILHMKYVLGMEWKDIIPQIPYVEHHVYELHGTALQKFARQYLTRPQ